MSPSSAAGVKEAFGDNRVRYEGDASIPLHSSRMSDTCSSSDFACRCEAQRDVGNPSDSRGALGARRAIPKSKSSGSSV